MRTNFGIITILIFAIHYICAAPEYLKVLPSANDSALMKYGVSCGICHVNPFGGGVRNQFGNDFQNANLLWSDTIASLDSDKDGYTNGEELCDPLGQWKPGKVLQNCVFPSHPGNPLSKPTIVPVENVHHTEIEQIQGFSKNDIRILYQYMRDLNGRYSTQLNNASHF